MTDFNTVPIEDLYESTLQSDLGSTDFVAKTVKIITGTLTGGQTTYMGINYDRPSKYELVEINAINGQDVTIVTRALATKSGGTGTAQNHPAGSKVIITHNYKVFEDIQTAINSKANILSPTIDEPTFTDWVKLPSYANAAARDAAILVPAKDMTVILDNDGDGKRCLTLYSGSAWINITLPGRNVTIDGFLIVAGGYVKFPVYADGTARDAAIPTPLQSMLVYNQAAVTLQLYDGSNWIDLDIGTPVPLATTSVPGRVRLATDQQVIDGTDDVGGEPLVVQPSQITLGTVVNATLDEDMSANTLVGIENLSGSGQTYVVSKALASSKTVAHGLGTVNNSKIIPLDNTRFFVLTRDGTNLKGVIATMDLATKTLSFGTPITYTTSLQGTVFTGALVDTDKVAVGYTKSTGVSDIRVHISTVSVSTITAGTEQAFATVVGTVVSLFSCQLTTNLCVFYHDATANGVHAFTVSGTTLTIGALEVVQTTIGFGSGDMLALNTDKFVCFSSSSGNTMQAGTVVGTTTTMGAVSNIAQIQSSWTFGTVLGTDKYVLRYRRDAGSTASNMICCSVSGNTITAGAIFTTSFGGGTIQGVSSSEFWESNSTSIRKHTVSGTTITFIDTVMNDYIVFPNFYINSVFIAIDIGGTNATYGVGLLSNNYIGILLQSGSRNDSRPVQLKSPVIQNASTGLHSGSLYISSNGTLSFYPTDTAINDSKDLPSVTAISDTDIILS
jgi:hypothetical protein